MGVPSTMDLLYVTIGCVPSTLDLLYVAVECVPASVDFPARLSLATPTELPLLMGGPFPALPKVRVPTCCV